MAIFPSFCTTYGVSIKLQLEHHCLWLDCSRDRMCRDRMCRGRMCCGSNVVPVCRREFMLTICGMLAVVTIHFCQVPHT